MSDFIRNKFLWLDQVAADGDLPPSALHLAYAIVKHLNRETGDAWPSQEMLANVIRTDPRSVRRMADRLRENGHIDITGKRGGRGVANHYCPIIKAQNTSSSFGPETRAAVSTFEEENPDRRVRLSDPKPGQFGPETRAAVSTFETETRTIRANKPGPHGPMNPLIREPFEKKDAAKAAFSDFKKSSLEPISLVQAIPLIGKGGAEAEQLETAARGTSDLEADLFRRGKEILGTNAGGLIAKLLKAKDRNIALARAAIELASTKQDSREYVNGIIRGSPEVKSAAELKADLRARGDAW